jgi:hypothetical protein
LIAAAAVLISSRASGLISGSMSVLRPDHDHRLRRPARVDVVGQLKRLADVVVENRATLSVEFQPEPRYVALHGGDSDRGVVTRADPGLPDMRPRQCGSQQNGADAHPG